MSHIYIVCFKESHFPEFWKQNTWLNNVIISFVNGFGKLELKCMDIDFGPGSCLMSC